MSDAPPTTPPTASPSEGIELAPGVRVPTSAIRLQYARSRGPGGQNVNKVNTKTDLWVPLTAIVGLTERGQARLVQLAGKRLTLAGEIHIASDSERTQELNRAAAFDRLREIVSKAMHEPKARRKVKPSKAAKRRRLEAKRRRSDVKSKRRSGGGED